MPNSPAVGGARQAVFIATGDDEIGATRCGMANMLRLQIAAVHCAVTIDDDLVVADEMLAVVQVLQRSTNAINDGIDTLEPRRTGQVSGGFGEEHGAEQRPVLGIERAAVPCDDGNDVAFVKEHRQVRGAGLVHICVHPPRHQTTSQVTATRVAEMFASPVQIAYAVGDVVAAAQRWAARGVGPFFVLDHIEVHSVRVNGTPATFDHSSAYAQWGSVMVELICQHDGGPNPVVGTAGVHHMAHFVDDFAAASTALTARGAVEILYAESASGMPFAFHDVRAEYGHLIEIYERTERLGRFYEMVRAASLGWAGDAAIRRL